MEKLNVRWGYGLFLGVRVKSGDLIVADGESKELKYVRAVKRILEEQRWLADILEWRSATPWNEESKTQMLMEICRSST